MQIISFLAEFIQKIDINIWKKIIYSLIAIIILIITRIVSHKILISRNWKSAESRLKWLSFFKNINLFLIFVILLLIWGNQLKNFALSVMAILAALVLATRELLLCISGSIIRSVSHSFHIGDRIEIYGIRGNVIDQTIFSTTILEIGPGLESQQLTGREVVIPNSMFLLHPVINETFTDEYILHIFNIPLEKDTNWKEAERILIEISNNECKGYIKEAARSMKKIQRKLGIDAPSVEPRVHIRLDDVGIILLSVRIPVPTQEKNIVEQKIIRKFLENFNL